MDGEATEDVVRELSEPARETQDPEVQFAIAAVFTAPFAKAGIQAGAEAAAANVAASNGLQVC